MLNLAQQAQSRYGHSPSPAGNGATPANGGALGRGLGGAPTAITYPQVPRHTRARRMLPYIALFFVLFVSVAALGAMYPKEVRGFLVLLDTKTGLNATREAQIEAMRIAQIKELAIPYVEKEVLMKGRIFKGASTDMARLALGQPNDQIDLSIAGYGKVTVLVYLFDGSSRYTGLQFVGGELKGSTQLAAPDVEKLRNDPRREAGSPQSMLPIAAQFTR